jgi:hypothetical protein
MHPKQAWKDLGARLEQRRGQLGYGYRQRGAFVSDRGGTMSVKTIARLERGERDSYPPATIASFEALYAWRPGSIERVLSGGEPELAGPHGGDRILALISSAWGDFASAPQHVREFALDQRWDEPFRYEWITDYIRRDPARGHNGGSTGRLREA